MDCKCVFMPRIEEPDGKFEQEFDTQEEAEIALNLIADYTLFLHETSLMPDYSNIGMIMKQDSNGNWIEIDEFGE